MVKQNQLSALPFFPSQDMQAFRHPAADGVKDLLALLCRYDRMLPFIIKKTPAAAPNHVLLCKADGLSALKIDTLLTTLSTETIDGVGYTIHAGSVDINPATSVAKYSGEASDNPRIWDSVGNDTYANFVGSGGYFYLDVSIGSPGERFFSELIYISDVPEFPELSSACAGFPYIRIEAVTDCPIGTMYPAGYANKLFVKNGSVRAPQYPIDRNVATDGNGAEEALWTRLRKLYAVGILCPESVADWAASLQLYTGGGAFNITDETGFQTAAKVESVTVDWPDQYNGIVADVEIRFSIEAAYQTGCC